MRVRPPCHRNRLVRYLTVTLLAVFCCISVFQPVAAQTLWEADPYNVQLWFRFSTHPLSPAQWRTQLTRHVSQRVSSQVGAAWNVNARQMPVAAAASRRISPWQLLQRVPELREVDKLFEVGVVPTLQGYELEVTELDLTTRSWGPTRNRLCASDSSLDDVLVELLVRSFRPLVRIDRVAEQTVQASVRAGLLRRPELSSRIWDTPIGLQQGQLLRPYLRRTDRRGNVGENGIRMMDWTVLQVREATPVSVTCQWESGYGQPFSTRRSSRVDQLAILIRPYFENTTVKLVDRKDEQQPLIGYEIFARRPGATTSTLVGRTDWQGEVVVPKDSESPIRVLFVKSGNRLLAKLPLAVGARKRVQAALRNDELRLEAEGFLLGIQESLIDLVVRRQLLATRVRQKIEGGEFDKADDLLTELRRLDTQEDFSRRVQQRKQTLTSIDSQVQEQIDILFAETRQLLGQYLNPMEIQQLQQQLDSARQKQAAR